MRNLPNLSAVTVSLLLSITPLAVRGQATAAKECAAVESLFPARICAPTPNGVVIANDADSAGRIGKEATAGEARFRTYFGSEPPRYVALEGGPAVPKTKQEQLRHEGFPVLFKGLTPEEFRAQAQNSFLEQVRAQGVAQGWTSEMSKMVEEKAATQFKSMADKGSLNRDLTIVPHELGHKWFEESFWPNFVPKPGVEYASPAPDWMDEAAAVLMEDDKSADDRRAQFRKGLLDGGIDDLPTFLTKEHPMLHNMPAGGNDSGAQFKVSVFVGSSAGTKQASQAALFYAEARVFADFLLDVSCNPLIFEDLGKAFSKGVNFETWLAERGKEFHLPSTVGQLSKAWQAWLNVRYASPQQG